MYFIKYQPLKEKLRSRSLSDRDSLPYYVLASVVAIMFSSVPLPGAFNYWDAASAFLGCILTIVGLIYAYHQNGGRNGYDVIQKCVVLGWVVSIRVLLCFIPLAIILKSVAMYLGIVTFGSTGWFDVFVMVSVYALIYLRLGRHIKDTNSKSSEHAPPVQPRSVAH